MLELVGIVRDKAKEVVIDRAFIEDKLGKEMKSKDLKKYIL